ncbi:MAG: hypothetical protein AABX96_00170 [Nanoarchaeota archaeon]
MNNRATSLEGTLSIPRVKKMLDDAVDLLSFLPKTRDNKRNTVIAVILVPVIYRLASDIIARSGKSERYQNYLAKKREEIKTITSYGGFV